ncbi:MAG: lysine N(6)-hydroxylase/L-ornithine N(5)-oxygenase family protein [Candidatus Angelobacter sp.]
MKCENRHLFDAVGVGLGPFNLSTAALLDPVKKLTTRFLEREKEFQWHPGLLFAGATLQVSFLKDLVTLADPTSSHSFLAFLFANRRLYRFINANFARVSRVEFNQYLRWVANRLPSLEFGREVDEITCDAGCFVVSAGGDQFHSRQLILGTGLQPNLPECARRSAGSIGDGTVVHASRFLQTELRSSGMRVAVVGGGETGAEIVHHLLSSQQKLPKELYWISKRANFLPLDESPFTNELFTPNYSDYFYGLSRNDRMCLLAEQKLASDGISNAMLERIYQLLYEAEFLNGSGRCCSLHPRCELVDMTPSSRGGWRLMLRDSMNAAISSIEADIVILATGWAYKPLPALEPIQGRLRHEDSGYVVRDDYSIEWDGPEDMKIYIQNGARHRRGVADPNLSLMAWRSAKIINSIAGERIYDIAESNCVFDCSKPEIMERLVENGHKSVNYPAPPELPAVTGFRRRHAGTRSSA